MKTYKKFFFCFGIIMFVSEMWKQWCLTFLFNNGHYNWWYFPFQLCSIPMYLFLLMPFISSEKICRTLLTFLMDFSLLGGIMTFFDTSGLHYSYLPLTIHSYIWHILLIILGIAIGRSRAADYSCSGFARSVFLYVGLCAAAECLNIAFGRYGTINMFYINPHLPMTQRVFSSIAAAYGNTFSIFTYVTATIAGAGVLHLLWHFYFSKKNAR